MIRAGANHKVGLPLRQVRILVAQPDDDIVVQRIRHIGVRHILPHDVLDAGKLRPRLTLVGARDGELRIELGDLLLVHQATAGIDDIIAALELHDRPLGIRCLLAQFLEAILQPQSSALGGVVLGLELIDHISLCDRIGDLRRLIAIRGRKADLEDEGDTLAFDAEPPLELLDRGAGAFEFRVGPARQHEAAQTADQGTEAG